MPVKAKDLVQIAPLYYELINPAKNQKKFWEIVPSSWNQNGSITSFSTAWGRIGCNGSSKPQPGKDAYELNKLIETKTRKGYRLVERPEYRTLVPIAGMEPGNIGIVLSIKGWGNWNNVAELLLNGLIVRFPVRFLTVIKASQEE
jgi:predicted DNA-binding WGR domain protein